jgi:CRP-like cAMP-binding protein
MPLGLLRGVRRVARFFQWGQNLADRLAFTEVVATGKPLDANMDNVYETFQIDPKEITTLEEYMRDYFSRIMRKLKELNYESDKDSKKKFPF